MKSTIDWDKLQEENIPMEMFCALMPFHFRVDITENTFQNMKELDLITTFDGKTIITTKGEALMGKFIKTKSDVETVNLANTLRKMFPAGRKEGTSYMWRDSTYTIVRKLEKFEEKYGKYPKEAIIEATRRYIDSFNGDYQYMQLLKYFINKKNMLTGDEESQLLSYLSNTEENESDWRTELR